MFHALKLLLDGYFLFDTITLDDALLWLVRCDRVDLANDIASDFVE